MSGRLQPHKPILGSLCESISGIDVGLLTGSKSEQAQAAAQIRNACIETGFFCIDNFLAQSTAHGRLLARMKHFFDRVDSDPLKKSIDVTGQGNSYGWMPMFQEPAYQPGTIAHLESFDCGREKRAGNDPGWTPNRWPAIPGFRDDVRAAWDELTMIGMASLRALALAFELRPDFFVERCNTQDLSTMRLLHYPAHTSVAETADVGIAAHTDFECITLTSQTAPGLELLDVNGDWYDAPAHDDRLLVMPGDMLETWTNGICKATGHRVRTRGWQRYSVVLFFGVNDEVTVTPQNRFITAGNAALYPDLTQREHSQVRLREAEMNRKAFAKDQIM